MCVTLQYCNASVIWVEQYSRLVLICRAISSSSPDWAPDVCQQSGHLDVSALAQGLVTYSDL